ncbi:MAG: hypothetical protein KAJ53_02395, partial [Anaerolineales bacterium]|nr:hypothetical protein [Anaerolineales bacterium]
GQAAVTIEHSQAAMAVYREGNFVDGKAIRNGVPVLGWRSTTYSVKTPALHLVAEIESSAPFRVLTWWAFEDTDRRSVDIGWRNPGDSRVALDWVEYKGTRLEIDDAYFAHPSSRRSTG